MAKKRLGNKGFSLLELLIGITMLAIIVVPIMHAFVTSSSTSNKAREVRNQTVAAQNVLESYESTDVVDLISALTTDNELTPFKYVAQTSVLYADTAAGYVAVTSESADKGDGPRYRIALSGIGDNKYDAVLNIDATVTKYQNRNSAGIVDYKPMDAVYIQPEPADDNNPDNIAAKDFASQAQIDSGMVVDSTYFMDKMIRNVTITMQKIGEQTGIISCTAQFRYQTQYTYTLTDTSKTPAVAMTYVKDYAASVSNDFYSGTYTAGENGIYGLYFFFYPNLNITNNTDTIEVMNTDNIDMSIYLVRQTADTGINNPVIKLMEKASAANTPFAQMYYNKVSYQYKYYIGFGTDVLNYFWFKTFMFDGDLIGTPAKNRLYEVTVDLYKAGDVLADGSTKGPILATFDASSLE